MLAVSARAGEGADTDEMAAVGSVDLSRARSDMIVRYFRRLKKPFANTLPDEIEMAVGTAFMGLTREDGGENAAADIQSRRFYPLDALHRVEANNAIMSWHLGGGGRSQIAPADAVMIMKVNQGLIAALPTGQGGLSFVRRVSDAYFGQGESWIAHYARLDSRSADQIEDVFSQGVRTVGSHWNYLASLPAGRFLSSDRQPLEERLRNQAHMLIGTARANIRSERYRTLLRDGRTFLARMCPDEKNDGAECAGLRNTVDEIARSNSQIIAAVPSSPLAGASPETVWTDRDNVALGGWDPVTCFDSATSLARPTQGHAAPKDPGGDARSCSLRKGRLEYALRWGEQVWLFERQDNLMRFQSDPSLYMPRLGGYDFAAIRDSRKEKQSASRLAGMLVGRRLYISQNYAPTDVPPEDVRKAEENWPRLKSVPDIDSGANVPVGGDAYSAEDAIAALFSSSTMMVDPAADAAADALQTEPDTVMEEAGPGEDAAPDERKGETPR
jgi:hypothetical protein